MAIDRFSNIAPEDRVMHESWDKVARVMLFVTLFSAVVWTVCSFMRWLVHGAAHWLFHDTAGAFDWGTAGWLVGILTLGGLVRGLLFRRPGWEHVSGDGMNIALDHYHCTYDHLENDPQPRYDRPAFALASKKALGTVLTLGSGGSGGLEGPVVLISECICAGLARIAQVRSEAELRTYQLAGIAAGVCTLLLAPFTAALFAVEAMYGDRLIYRKFAYALLGAMTAYILNELFLGFEPIFVAAPQEQSYTLSEYGICALVAVAVSAPVALAFGTIVIQVESLVSKVHPILQGAAGGLIAGLVAVGLWGTVGLSPEHVLGMGEDTISALLSVDSEGALKLWWVLALALLGKMATTSATVRTGGSAGLLVPSMFLGGVAGATTAQLLALTGILGSESVPLFVVVGIASSLVAVVGVPLAAIALVLEVFGASFGPPAVLACGLTYVLTLRLTIYRSQRRSPDPSADETGGVPKGD
jgi:CIC family chloride channel protein